MTESSSAMVHLDWLDHLRHMLRATSDIPQKKHGYRNHFCAEIGGKDYLDMVAMEKSLLVAPGAKINAGRDQYFHATLAGCKAIGMGAAAIKRAMQE